MTAATSGTYVNTIAAGAITTSQGSSNTSPASATLTVVNAANVTLTKAFSPTPIVTGGTSTLTLTVANTAASAIALTGISLNDSLPSGVTVATVPNASTTCGAGTVSAAAGGTLVTLAGGSVAAAATCTVSVNVTSAAAGTYLNTVPSGTIVSDQGSTNGAPASATLVVNNAPGVTVAKSFLPASIALNGTSVATVTITNAAAGAVALTGLAFNDALPSGTAVAATPNASTTCGSGTVTAVPGTSQFALGAGGVGAGASCTVTVSVTGTAAGSFVNTIAANTVTSTQGATNAAPATATLTVAAPNVTLTKAFGPSTIFPSGISVLTISVANTASGSVALTGIALSDALPSGVTIAATPGASTTCGSGSVAATAGGSTVALTAGSVGAAATCTISVNVTATVPATYPNTIAAGAVTSDQGATNAAPATASLLVVSAPNVTLAKAFSPTTIPVNGTSTLTLTISNTASGAVPLTGLSVSDGLPSGMVIAPVPNPATTCGSGTVGVTPGGTTIIFAGGSVGAGASCTISANVTSSAPGSYVNTVATGAVSSTQGATSSNPATATLTVAVPDVSIVKAFTPAQITPHGTSVLTVTLQNTGTGAIALTGMALTDSLPAGVNVAATPGGSTTCGSGTVTATAGATSVALTGGSVAAAASCTLTVNVTSNNVGTYTNTIGTGALTTTQGATNSAPATAVLSVVNAANVTLTKAFSPTPIFANGVSVLTLTVANTAAGASALTSLALTDTLPSGVAVAAVPNASTTCGSGTASATAGGATLTLAAGTVAAGGSCIVSVNVTSATPGSYVNTVPAGGVSSDQGATNTAPAGATLVVNNAPPVTLTKTFTPPSIALNGTSVLQSDDREYGGRRRIVDQSGRVRRAAAGRFGRGDTQRVHDVRRRRRNGGSRRGDRRAFRR